VKPDVKSILFSEEFRSATWICISIAAYNMMSGIHIISANSTKIFDKIGEEGTYTTSQKNYFVGISGFLGAFLSNFTVAFLTRRTLLIGGHILMCVFLLMTAIFIVQKNPDATIYSMSAFIICYQSSTGSLLWVYVSDVGTATAFGFSLFTLMLVLSLQTVSALSIMNWYGVDGMFFGFSAFQMITVTHLYFYMKESKGLPEEEKKSLYKP